MSHNNLISFQSCVESELVCYSVHVIVHVPLQKVHSLRLVIFWAKCVLNPMEIRTWCLMKNSICRRLYCGKWMGIDFYSKTRSTQWCRSSRQAQRDTTSLVPAKAGSIGATRLDVFQAAALMEVFFQWSSLCFQLKKIMEIMGSDLFAFNSCYSDEIKSPMQPVMLTIIIMSSTHVHKTIVNTESGTCALVKGKDILPNWIIAAASQSDNPEEGSVQAIIRDWEDRANSMFSFEPGSTQEAVFKKF